MGGLLLGSSSIAARVGFAGAACLVLWTAGVLLAAWLWPEPYAGVWALVLEMAFTGRAVNIAHGYADGYSPYFLLFQCGLQDVWLVLLMYPLLVAGDAGIGQLPVLGGIRRSMESAATTHQDRIARWGVPGLAFMVFVPFWSTGALVGTAIGHALGLGALRLMAVVIGAHLASVLVLLWLFDHVVSWTEALNGSWLRFLPWMVLALLATVHFAGKLYARWRLPG